MCLSIDINQHCLINKKWVPKKAEEDIHVFKVLDVCNGVIRSIYQKHVWEKGFIYYITDKKPFSFSDNKHVERGLHACTTFKRAKDILSFHRQADLFKAVIPKGSLYFIGYNDEIVSNQLQIL